MDYDDYYSVHQKECLICTKFESDFDLIQSMIIGEKFEAGFLTIRNKIFINMSALKKNTFRGSIIHQESD